MEHSSSSTSWSRVRLALAVRWSVRSATWWERCQWKKNLPDIAMEQTNLVCLRQSKLCEVFIYILIWKRKNLGKFFHFQFFIEIFREKVLVEKVLANNFWWNVFWVNAILISFLSLFCGCHVGLVPIIRPTTFPCWPQCPVSSPPNQIHTHRIWRRKESVGASGSPALLPAAAAALAHFRLLLRQPTLIPRPPIKREPSTARCNDFSEFSTKDSFNSNKNRDFFYFLNIKNRFFLQTH